MFATGDGPDGFVEFAFGGGDLAESAFGLFALFGGGEDAFDGGAGFGFEAFLGFFDLFFNFAEAGGFAAGHVSFESAFAGFELLPASAKGFGFGAGGLDGGFEFAEEAGDIAAGGGHGGAGAADEAFGEAEFGGDIEASALAGCAGAEDVGGGEGVLVVAHGGIEDAFGGGAVNLDGEQVGGGEGITAAAAEFVEDGDAEGAAFIGVGGAAEFVEQDEGAGLGGFDHFADAGDVGAETGEGVFDGLVVADVGEDVGEDGEGGFGGGDGPTGLGHEGERTGGFHGDGLAAGVGAGNEEGAQGAVEGEGEGDDAFPLAAKEVVEEGVAGVLEVKDGGFVGGESGDDGVGLYGEVGAGEDGVEGGEGAGGEADFGGVFAEACGQFGEDAMDFAEFFIGEADEVVVEFDGFEGFDEEGLSRPAGGMDDARGFLLGGRDDGDDEAVVADGDELFLEEAVVAVEFKEAVEGFVDGAFLAFEVPADAGEGDGGVVVEGAVGEDLAGDGAEGGAEVADLLGVGGEE
ncbi:MAG TPA: hypothetical protein PLF84_19910, partial [Bryobacteraceae bacterium]|nr:hypothetical protein [Bryobacteraceae bacterium]